MQFGGYHIRNQQGVYFLTFTVVDWIDTFTRPHYKQLLIDTLKFYQNSRGLLIFGYVIMSNHLHLIAQTPEDSLSDFIRDFKRWTSREMKTFINLPQESRKTWMLAQMELRGTENRHNQDYQFWRNGSHPVEIFSLPFAWQKLNYIHQNPVSAGWVDKAEEYLYSSARDYAGEKGVLPITFLETDLGIW